MAKAQRKKHKCVNNSHDQIKANTNTINNNPINSSIVKRKRKIFPRDSPFQRSSKFRGVTRHRWTGRYEAHLWDKDCWNDSQKKKGRQVYLGAYDDEVTAARAYDLAALKYWGKDTILNFSLSNYENEMKVMDELTKEEYLGSLRRKSNGFSRGVSKYRGVARHHHNGRWEARIGRVLGNKYLYLGTFATQEEAATAYDMAAIQYRGLNAVTNFDLSRYLDLLKPDISCDGDQPTSPNDVDPINNNLTIEDNTTSASTCSSDNHQSSLTFDHHHHHRHDHDHHHHDHHQLVDDAISIDELLWGQPSLPDCSSTLLLDHFNNNNEYDLLRCDQPHDNIVYSSMDGQCSSMDDVGNNKDQDFFSDLDSLLCDFDVMEATQIEI